MEKITSRSSKFGTEEKSSMVMGIFWELVYGHKVVTMEIFLFWVKILL